MNKNFFAGIEEVISRLLAAVISMVFFLIYIYARPDQEVTLNWSGLLAMLGIFWLVYEFIGYVLYLIFVYFSRQNNNLNSQSKDIDTNI